MLGEDGGRARGVACQAGVEQGLVLGVDVARDGVAEQAQAPVALGLLVEDVLETTDPARGATRRSVPRGRRGCAAPTPRRPASRGRRALLGARGGGKPRPRGLPVLAAELQRLAQGFGLEQQAGAGDVLEVLDGNRRDAEAALSLGDHQGVGDEQEEGLAQGAGADLVAVPEMFDAKFLAGRVNALDDVPAQALVGPSTRVLGSTASGVLCGTASFMIAKMLETPGSRFYPSGMELASSINLEKNPLTSTLPWPIFKNITNQT